LRLTKKANDEKGTLRRRKREEGTNGHWGGPRSRQNAVNPAKNEKREGGMSRPDIHKRERQKKPRGKTKTGSVAGGLADRAIGGKLKSNVWEYKTESLEKNRSVPDCSANRWGNSGAMH